MIFGKLVRESVKYYISLVTSIAPHEKNNQLVNSSLVSNPKLKEDRIVELN